MAFSFSGSLLSPLNLSHPLLCSVLSLFPPLSSALSCSIFCCVVRSLSLCSSLYLSFSVSSSMSSALSIFLSISLSVSPTLSYSPSRSPFLALSLVPLCLLSPAFSSQLFGYYSVSNIPQLFSSFNFRYSLINLGHFPLLPLKWTFSRPKIPADRLGSYMP